MRLNRSDLRLIQEGLELLSHDAEFELEIASNDESRCRWATETIDQAETIYSKLNVIIEALTNLHKKDVSADVLLAPGLLSDP